ncbi:MAG: phosphoenolpyruvate synthase [archaeon]
MKKSVKKKAISEHDSSDFIKWFSEISKNDVKTAGGKGANLGEMYNFKIPVPPGFAVTAQAYDYFIEKAGIKEKISKLLGEIEYSNTRQLDETTKKIRELVIKSEMPEEMRSEIVEAYETLNFEWESDNKTVNDILKRMPENVFVAVRSSATAEDLEDASFAGQQETFLNIKGNENLIEAIKKCFASLFTSRATYYRQKKGFKHEETSLAVIVQKMVDSDKSGVIFSKDPSYKNDNVIIEAVFGLGEGIVSGKITPDKYVVSGGMEIIDEKIANKKIAITRNSGGEQTEVKLSNDKANSKVLKDGEIKKLAELSLKLEKHYQKPQDIEFAIEGDEIYIVQTRAITTVKNRIEIGDAEGLKGEIILKGLAASPGIAAGKIRIVRRMEDLDKIKEGDVLVTKMTNPDMVVSMQKAAAIVTDEGGLTAHAAIVSREMGIPCVVGTGTATEKLKEGEIITVDGFRGEIYKGKLESAKAGKKEILPVTAKTKTKIKVIVDLPSFAQRASKAGIKEVGLLRIEGIIAESGKHPYYFLEKNKIQDYENVICKGVDEIAKYFDELWVRTSDIRSDEFQNLDGAKKEKEANPMLGMHGIRFGVKEPEILKAELNALKRVAAKKKRIGVMMPQVISVDEVKKTKEILKEINFSDAKVGVMIETPASVQIIRELCEEGIDFISFGTNDLTQYILAVDRGNEQVQHLYNEMHPAVLRQLGYVLRVAKKNKVETSICGQAGSRKEMVKFLVEREIDSISVNADVAKEISDYVSELESGKVPEEENEETKEKTEVVKDKEKPEREGERQEEKKLDEKDENEIQEEQKEGEKEQDKDKEEIKKEKPEKEGEEEKPEKDVEKNESGKEEEQQEEKKEGLDIF